MPPILLIIGIAVFIIASTISKSKKQAEAQERSKRLAETVAEAEAKRSGMTDLERAADATERAAQELHRRLEAQRASAQVPAQNRGSLDRPTLTRNMDKPVAAHSDEDCGGGSIHDGYHEGVSVPPVQNAKRPVAIAGGLGHRLADEDDRIAREAAAAENAKRAMARIAKRPPLAQGIVYAEILGRPKSEAV